MDVHKLQTRSWSNRQTCKTKLSFHTHSHPHLDWLNCHNDHNDQVYCSAILSLGGCAERLGGSVGRQGCMEVKEGVEMDLNT